MTKFYNTSPDEQETIINIDYSEKKANVYSSRKRQSENKPAKLKHNWYIFLFKFIMCQIICF